MGGISYNFCRYCGILSGDELKHTQACKNQGIF